MGRSNFIFSNIMSINELTHETPSKSEARIDSVGARAGATEDGLDWLSYCLDPFKDAERDAKGMPDMVASRSIIQVVPQSIEISNPAPGANWDASISLSPLVTKCTMAKYVFNPDYPNLYNIAGVTGGPVVFGGLEVRSATAGTTLDPQTMTDTLPLPASFIPDGNVRVLGMAMEIHNTTSPLNRQGDILVYRDQAPPLNETTNVMIGNSLSVIPTFGSFNTFNLPSVPETLKSARIMPTARSWKAEDGAYCVSTMSSSDNPPVDATSLLVWPQGSDDAGAKYLPLNATVGIGAAFAAVVPTGSSVTPSAKPLFTPLNLVGAFLTGLSDATTLRVDVKWILETFPDHDDVNLVVLAKKRPALDVVALELYSRMAHNLPPGVPVADNAAGDWIAGLADLAVEAGLPFAGPIRSGLNLARKAFGIISDVPNEKKLVAKVSNDAARINSLTQQVQALERRRNFPPLPKAPVARAMPALPKLPGTLSKGQRSRRNRAARKRVALF
jgi:hypothetical protein